MATRSVAAPSSLAAPAAARAERVLTGGLVAFSVYDLALAAWMAVSPHTFYVRVGPFGAPNDHYVRDVATYNAAIGAALAIAVTRPTWRAPVLALTTLQFALHSVNHLVDIGKSHPAWNGPADFASLTVATVALAWLLREAARARRGPSPPPPIPGAPT
jgi:hypothetical protein